MELDGKPYRINTDFRAGIAYSSALLSGTPLPAGQLVRLFFPDEQPAEAAALAAISEFIRCGAPAPEEQEAADAANTQPAPYSFLTDSAALQAEFQRVYGIDLFSAKLHWWRFMALLRGLISHSFSERVKYRVAELDQIKDETTRRHWRHMKQLYALDPQGRPRKQPKTVEEYNEMLLAQARGERW